MKKAIIVLSGGLDSALALAIALDSGYECIPIAFDYEQRHIRELRAARSIVNFYCARDKPVTGLRIVKLTGMDFGNTALVSNSVALPRNRTQEQIENEISSTYVPSRNAIFISIAAAHAEALGAESVWTGFNYNDSRGTPVPDGRIEFVRAIELALMLGTKCGVTGNPITIETPLIRAGKEDIVRSAFEYRVPIHLTWSCFAGGSRPCGICDACVSRAAAFSKVKRNDPALAPTLRLRST